MGTKGISIAGRKRKPEDNGFDNYSTPEWATQALLDREQFFGIIWEPCCGSGRMLKVLTDRYGAENVIGTDIQCAGKIDFLKSELRDARIRSIITNPPFFLIQEIAQHAIDLLEAQHTRFTQKVALFGKLAFLESQSRGEWFTSGYAPNRIYVFSPRVDLYPEGTENPRNGGTIAYAWYVWNLQKRQEGTEIRWITSRRR